jgi:hypothetical protein
MGFLEALGNIVRTFVSRALTYVLLILGIVLLLANRSDAQRRAQWYRAIGVLLLGVGLGSIGSGLATRRVGQ